MDKPTLAIIVSGCAATFTLGMLVLTGWRFKYELPKMKLEIQKLKRDLATVEVKAFDATIENEIIIYDSRNRDVVNDFTGGPSFAWSDEKKNFLDVMGKGNHSLTNGIIDINRTNTEGRYSVSLKRYIYNNPVEFIPVDKSINGKRKLKLSCDVKCLGGEHTISFIFKSHDNKRNLDLKEYRIYNDNWEAINFAFSIDTDIPSFLRIDDINVSRSPSSVQIRNLILSEKSA